MLILMSGRLSVALPFRDTHSHRCDLSHVAPIYKTPRNTVKQWLYVLVTFKATSRGHINITHFWGQATIHMDGPNLQIVGKCETHVVRCNSISGIYL